MIRSPVGHGVDGIGRQHMDRQGTGYCVCVRGNHGGSREQQQGHCATVGVDLDIQTIGLGSRRYFRKAAAVTIRDTNFFLFRFLEFFDLLTELYAMERQFKNTVLTTYHEESVTGLNAACEAFWVDTKTVRKRLSADRREFHYKLKPSHGHPRNACRLESLMDDFRRLNAECMDTLSGTCDRVEVRTLFFLRFHAG